MREIKFRAWNKKAQDMGDWHFLRDAPIHISWLHWAFKGNDHIILMQYTGLKDKNGVEIYEGDIVLMPEIDKRMYEVYWSTLGTPRFWFADMSKTSANSVNIGNNGDALEVIGNIYQNPELLEVKHEN